MSDILAMDSWEWTGWLAFAQLEPFGPLRDDLRAGAIAAAVLNAAGIRTTPERIFPSLKESRPRGRDDEAMKRWAKAHCPALTPINW